MWEGFLTFRDQVDTFPSLFNCYLETLIINFTENVGKSSHVLMY